MNTKVNQVGSRRPVTVTVLRAEYNMENVSILAKAMTRVIKQHLPTVDIDSKQLDDFHIGAIQASMSKELDVRISTRNVQIPSYVDSMVNGLKSNVRGVQFNVEYIGSDVALPDSYKETGLILRGAGIGMVPLRYANTDNSNVFAIGIEEVDNVEMVVGNLNEVVVEELVTRTILALNKESTAKWRSIVGHLELQYGEVDVLLTEWASSNTRVSLGSLAQK